MGSVIISPTNKRLDLKKALEIAAEARDPRLGPLLAEVKAREDQGFAYDSASASFELLAREHLGQRPRFFNLERFRVTVERRFNAVGEVVGINTAIFSESGGSHGIGFAIPVNTAKPLIPQLVAHGKITRGYLGVSIQSLTADLAGALQVDEREGALVADVVSGSPADKGGIERGDIRADRGYSLAVFLYEQAMACPARQGFQPQRAAACIEIQAAGATNHGTQPVEQRFPHPVRGRPQTRHRFKRQPSPTPGSGNDAYLICSLTGFHAAA